MPLMNASVSSCLWGKPPVKKHGYAC